MSNPDDGPCVSPFGRDAVRGIGILISYVFGSLLARLVIGSRRSRNPARTGPDGVS